LRLRAQDQTAEAEYGSWILASAPPESGFVTTTRLNPLIEEPSWGEPIARKLFLGDKAPWNPVLRLRDGDRSVLDAILGSRLPKLEAVRECLERGMADRTVIGEVSRQDRGLVKYAMNGNKGSGGYSRAGMEKADPRDPAVGVKVPLRVCDMIAMAMSHKGLPEFRPYWSDANKDSALREVVQFMRKEGAKLVDLRPGPPMSEE